MSYVLAPHVAAALRDASQRIAVIGASGWIGQATLAMLAEALGDRFGERVVAFGSSARDVGLLRQAQLTELSALPPRPTLVLSLAYLTKDKVGTLGDDAYRGANSALTAQVVAALDSIGTTGVFHPSSGAAYAADDADATPAMRLYGGMKLADEAVYRDWAKARGKALVTARIFNLSGPCMNKVEHYALAAFIGDARAGRPVRISAMRPVFRSFVAISELMSLVFALLMAGESASFDTAGDDVFEMGELAAAVQAALGGGAGIERPPLGDGAADRYVGARAPYAALLARHGLTSVPFADQVRETAMGLAA